MGRWSEIEKHRAAQTRVVAVEVAANQQVASGSGQSITATGTLTMNNLGSSQNTCQNANLTLNFTSS